MPKFICQKEDCPKCGIIQTVDKIIITVKNGKSHNTGSICSVCGSKMDSLNPMGFTTYMTGSDNICKK